MKGENTKNILLGVLIVGLVSMTVAFAALSTNLKIEGTAEVEATTWDIHFANVEVANTTTIAQADYNLGTLNSTAIASGTTGTLIQGLTANLAKPGDKLVVNFDIVNAGTIDAKNTSFTKHITQGAAVVNTDTADTNDVVNYTITCGTGGLGTNDVLTKAGGANATSSCTLTVEYNDTAASITQQSQVAGGNQAVSNAAKTFTFDANWVYQQN